MKLIVFKTDSEHSRYRIGALVGSGAIADLTSLLADRDLSAAEVLSAFDLDGEFSARAARTIETGDHPVVAFADVAVCAPVPRPGKIICVGLNYRDHAEESGMAIPSSPIIFSKFGTCVIGPGDTVCIPAGSAQTDYEAELAVVVGRRAKNVPPDDAMRHVFGYVNFNDVSARDFQFADGQWVRGKSCDTFAPIGEFVATADEIDDPHDLRIRLRLNGETMQDSRTDQLIFRIPEIIAFLSRSMTLEPGDVIATGTPPGVGFARKPPIYLKDGDVVEVEIDGLGILRNIVRED